ncbi:hypothetical protein QQZ08_011831 [Neonectria magnoliae]|uniref:Uncharacterized protein n=1 Tax=Neonectria magnoliae TaxID=2732573 RepID=A0ABR1H7P7_9HYPO
MAATLLGEASRTIEFTTIEKLFEEIRCTIGDMLQVYQLSSLLRSMRREEKQAAPGSITLMLPLRPSSLLSQLHYTNAFINHFGLRLALRFIGWGYLMLGSQWADQRFEQHRTPLVVKAMHQEVQTQNALTTELGQP